MRNISSYRLLLLVGVLSVSIFSLNTFVMLPAAVVVSNQPQQPLLQSAFATFPGENGKIAFSSQRDGNAEIYVMNADGSEQTNISNNPAPENLPDWSPDGTKIAFARHSPDDVEIYVMNADGSEQTNISNNPAFDNWPNWSPDGTKIAFTSTRDGNGEIYVMNADGTNTRRLTNNNAEDFHPNWSPDGTKIVFGSTRDGLGNEEIYVMNADGSEQTRLTNNDDILDYYPDWSPDGTKIAFTSTRDGNGEIYVMNADGTNTRRLTFTESAAEEPTSWSPDGTKIVFGSTRDVRIPDSTSGDTHNWEIYVMNADGSEQTRLTNNPAIDDTPDWGPATDTEPPADTTAPVLTVPDDIVVNATTANGGTVVIYNVTAEDNVDGTATLEEDNTLTQDEVGGDITISCDPPSSSEFPVGETEVECIAIDEAGNEGTASFTVTVNPPPPVPDPLTVEINSNATQGMEPATFEFEAIVTGGAPPYTYNWDFGDGSNPVSNEQTVVHTYYEAGVYTVTLTVTDSNEQQQQQEATDTLEITVTERPPSPPPPPPTTPREAIERLISYIENLEDVPESAKTRLTSILERALGLLTDNNTRNDASACNMLGTTFINQVNANERRDNLAEDQAADLRTLADNIRDMLGC